jgi:frataxin-like iron-binding protein CyaY
VPTRAVAASMGHTHQTHMRYYGEWIDHKSVEELFDQFNQAVAQT